MEYNNKWQTISADEALRVFGTDERSGLTDRRAELSRRRWGSNSLWDTGSVFMFLKNIRGTWLIGYALLLVAALCGYFFGKFSDIFTTVIAILIGAVIIGGMYVISGAICVAHAKKWVPHCRVIRNGKEVTLNGDSVVPGDIIILKKGDICVADVKIISADGVTVREGNVTGRRGAVSKESLRGALSLEGGAVPEDYIYAMSEILSGECTAVVSAVGRRTLFYQRRGVVRLCPPTETGRLRAMRKRGSAVSTALCVFSFFAVAASVFSPLSSFDVVGSLLICLALAASVGDEFLPAVGCLTYALAMRGCSERSLVLRDMSGVDFLIGADAYCFEDSSVMKTGETRLSSLYYNGNISDPGAPECDGLFEYLLVGTEREGGRACEQVRKGVVSHMKSRTAGETDSFTAAAIGKRPILDHECQRGVSYTIYAESTGVFFLAVGNIEDVLPMCKTIRINGKDIPLDRKSLDSLLGAAKKASLDSSVILAAAVRPSIYNSMKRLSVLTSDLTFIGFAALDSLADKDMLPSLERLRESGVRTVMFTDGSNEDIIFARRMGIIDGRDDVIKGGSENVCALMFSENTASAAVLSAESDTVTDTLRAARSSGRRVVTVGGAPSLGAGVFTVTDGQPKRGSGAYTTDSSAGAALPVLHGGFAAAELFDRYSKVERLYLVSVVLRALYAVTAVFGSPFVYPSLFILWSALVDNGFAAAILFSKTRSKTTKTKKSSKRLEK